MEKYIPLAALVAEIESKRKYAQTLGDNAINSSMQQFYDGMKKGCVDILLFLDTLEVKEVDLDREMQAFALLYLEPLKISNSNIGISITMAQLYSCAKHFFELGLKTQKGENVII